VTRLVRMAVIGGSGLYRMEGLTDVEEALPETPFGPPSDPIVMGDLDGVRVAFLARHGRGHRLNPTQLPARANIYALKSLGVERIISVSAVGSLKEEVRPLDMVIPDQLIDRTRGRPSTFFDEGVVVHAPFADPFCPELSAFLADGVEAAGAAVHRSGTYVVMEGPLFSTRAESFLYRSWGASIIGMTALPEAKLAREAELCYATLACVTDYDGWHETEESVSAELVVRNLQRNAANAQHILRGVLPRAAAQRSCQCHQALGKAIVTATEAVPAPVKERLRLLLGKYLS